MCADTLEFYTTHVYADGDSVTGGLGKIELALEEDTDQDSNHTLGSYMLVRRVTTNLLSPRDVDPEEQVLCRNVRSLNLRYYDEEDGWISGFFKSLKGEE